MSEEQNDFENLLDEIAEEYDKSKPIEDNVLPPGQYQFVLDNVDTKVLEKNGTSIPCVIWSYVVAAGEHQGEVVQEWNRLTGRSLPFFKSNLRKYGISPETPLKEALVAIATLGRMLVTGTIKHSPNPQGGSYVNLSVNKVLGEDNTAPV